MKEYVKKYLKFLLGTIGAALFLASIIVPAVLALKFHNLYLLFLYILTLPFVIMIIEES